MFPQDKLSPLYQIAQNMEVSSKDYRILIEQASSGHDAMTLAPYDYPEGYGLSRILHIVDISDLKGDQEKINAALGSYGAEKKSDLRDVTIMGKKYSFETTQFGEGFPTSENCYQGGGISHDIIVIEDTIAVMVDQYFSEKGCEGETPVRTEYPNTTQLEELLGIVEAIEF